MYLVAAKIVIMTRIYVPLRWPTTTILAFSLISYQLHLPVRHFILCTSIDTIGSLSYSSTHFPLSPAGCPIFYNATPYSLMLHFLFLIFLFHTNILISLLFAFLTHFHSLIISLYGALPVLVPVLPLFSLTSFVFALFHGL